jgi:acetolactate synthase-1/2/3 large subunit
MNSMIATKELTVHTHRFGNGCGAHLFLAALKRHRTEVIFGQSIPSLLHLIAPEFGIRQIGYRTENAGAAMADAYARVSRKVPVVTAQNGPAATLLVAGLAEALKASVPILAIVQEVQRSNRDRNAFQELDHAALFAGCAKWIRRVDQVSRITDYVDMAFVAAASGRPGPAVLLCPIDLFEDPIGDVAKMALTSGRLLSLGGFPLDRPVANQSAIREAARLLAEAERPLVIAGGGVHLSGAGAELANLQELAALPVATTSMGKGSVDEFHPLSVGVVGYFMGRRGMARYNRGIVEQADVVLLVGNRTNQNGTDSWTLYPPAARYIHIDIDGQEIGRNYEALRLQGDAATTLEALATELATLDLGKRRKARQEVEKSIAAGRDAHAAEAMPVMTSQGRPIRPERVMAELDRRLTPESVVVSDASYSSIWTANFLRSRKAGARFLSPRGMAGLGWGLPFAIGARIARPDAPIYCLTGDGGFGHVWSELETARRHELKLIVIVINNQVLGYQAHAEDLFFGDHTDVCAFTAVDHAAIARACGCFGQRIEDPQEIGEALDRAAARGGVTLLDIVSDPEAYPPVTAFDAKSQGARG